MKKQIDYVDLGQRIRSIRKGKKITQDGLAKKIGVATSLIGHIERGLKRPSLDVFAGICEELEVDAHCLLFGTGAVGEDGLTGGLKEEMVREMNVLKGLLECCLREMGQAKESEIP